LIILFLQDEVVVLAFAVGGVSLKLADFYGERESSAASYIYASVSAVALGLLISHSPISSSIILGIAFGVVLSGKVNRPNLIFGLALTLLTALIFSFKLPVLWLLLTVALSSFVDEITHDRLSSKRFFFANFFLLRPFLKLTILSITALSLISVVYAVGFFCFDLSYDTASWLLNSYLARFERRS
jgi:hypothetical protein